MPKSQPHTNNRREQILAAAMACFARQGYHATPWTMSSANALPVGAIYTYFPKRFCSDACSRPWPVSDIFRPGPTHVARSHRLLLPAPH
jgi:AcrR family transcriptional regulator